MEMIMKKLLAAAAVTLPLVTAGFAAAGEPMRLSDNQMDGVSAGAGAAAFAAAAGLGSVVLTAAETYAHVAAVDSVSSELTKITLHASEAASAAAVIAH
jgi:hypothetical protein